MKILLFDDILERHVRRSLARALRARAHTVIETAPVWHGHMFPSDPKDVATVYDALEDAVAEKPDALLNFRASSLNGEMLSMLRKNGIFTMVWLPDDPVLYSVCYRKIVEHYDIVLNCGGPWVIEFYEKHHDIRGVNVPFWTDNVEFPRSRTAKAPTTFDVAFLGNLKGAVRNKRYEILSSLPGEVQVFGQVDKDPKNIAKGYLSTEAEISEILGQAKLGFNIPQVFSDYRGHQYDFDGLARLGGFEFPSRVIQYAAIGLPIVTLGQARAPETFPEIQTGYSQAQVAKIIKDLLSDVTTCEKLSDATHARFTNSFSADARAEYLEYILENPGRVLEAPVVNRARLFADRAFLDTPNPQSTSQTKDELPSIPEQIEALTKTCFESPHKYRVLHLGLFEDGPTDAVACHLRALRNLGHAVRHVDISKNGAFIPDAPHPFTNIAPVFVDADSVLKAANGFRANVVICNGSGMVFSPEAAKRLKAEGLLLMGITLEDPEIFNQVVEHVGQFDLHFTNSVFALGKYRERGLTNTSLMQFAVDLGWILTKTPPSSEFEFDIVSINHSADRAEHSTSVHAVIDTFDSVRVYGQGWKIDGAQPVAGWEHLQASRGGLLHVTFPQNHAGVNSVPRAAFEAVGSGAVLLSPVFGELGDCFEYGSEIIGFDSTDELLAKIRSLLADPAQRDRIRRRAFKRLTENHLYERRWLEVFEKLEQLLSETNDVFDEPRRQNLNATLKATDKREVRVLVTGFYGHTNLGDELILESFIKNAALVRPEISFVIATDAPEAVSRDHGIEAVGLRDLDNLSKVAGNVDASILGGGGLWHDYSFRQAGGVRSLYDGSARSIGGYARPSLMAAGNGVPIHAYGVGVGPLTDADAKRFLLQIGSQMNTISVRDRESAEILKAIDGWEMPVKVVPDMVYAVDLPRGQPVPDIDAIAGDLPVMLVNLRSWSYADMDRAIERLAGALCAVLRESPFALIGLPMQVKGRYDASAIEQLFDRIQPDIPHSMASWTGDTARAISVINRADVVIGMRLHTCLLAHRCAKPTLGFSYDPKVRAHFEEIGRENYLIDFQTLPGGIEETLARLISPQAELSRETRSRIRSLEEASRSELRALINQLPRATHRRKVNWVEDAPGFKKNVKKIKLSERQYVGTDVTQTNWAYVDPHHPNRIAEWWNFAQDYERLALSVDAEGVLDARLSFPLMDKLYFTSGSGSFQSPSTISSQWPLEPKSEYQLSIFFEQVSGKPEVGCWLIEYDESSRLEQTVGEMRPGHNLLRLQTSPLTKSFRIALRMAGQGVCKIHPFRLRRL